jgi:hypothetical protein
MCEVRTSYFLMKKELARNGRCSKSDDLHNALRNVEILMLSMAGLTFPVFCEVERIQKGKGFISKVHL